MFAIGVLIASIAAHQSSIYLIFFVPVVIWQYVKGTAIPQLFMMMLFTSCSFFYISFFFLDQPQPLSDQTSFTWTSQYKINGNKLRGFAKADNGDKYYIVYTFQNEQQKRQYSSVSLAGYTFLASGEVVLPEPPAHDYAFSMADYLTSKGAAGVFEVSSWRAIEKNNSIQTKLAEQRFQLQKHIEDVFPISLAPEAQALLIGLQDHVDEDLQRAYQKLGITHLFAISGLHVALVAWIFFEGLLRLRVPREIATFVLLVALPIYGVIAGGAPSVWRSVSVVELVLIARYFKWRIPVDDALAMSFIGFVLLEPGVIFQVGFQLSYLATASLIYSGNILTRWSNWWVKSFFITFVCQLLVYPLLLWHFYEISISSFVVNIVFVPLFSFVILPINIVLFVISYISETMTKWLFILYEPLRNGLTDFILWLQALPFQLWSPGQPTILLVVLAYMSVFIVFLLLEQEKYRWHTLIVLLVPAYIIHFYPSFNKELRISVLNVGQGDCIVMELPFRRAVYVMDAGGLLRFEQEQWKQSQKTYEIGRQIVVPYLKGRGIRTIDIFMLSHADADHVEGAEEVLEEIRVREVHITPGAIKDDILQPFLKIVAQQNIPIKERMAGFTWQQHDVQMSYLWPKDTLYEGNNDSLVLFIEQGTFKMLLTGDLEEDGELALLKQYGERLENITVLKGGHHGSKTSSSERFVSHTRPKLTIFTAGRHNRFGHPHPTVTERFKQRQLPYIVTGTDGTVVISVNRHEVHIQKQ